MEIFIPIIIGATILALIAGILGCFVTWKQLAYFSDSISHSAILAISIAVLFNINTQIAGSVFGIIYAFLLASLQKRKYWQFDNLLGVFSQGFLALGILIIATNQNFNTDINSLLFGDILAINKRDIYFLIIMTMLILIWLIRSWRNLLVLTVNEELAITQNININRLKIKFLIILALFVNFAINLVGVLLITALLLIPPATAKIFSKSPLQMVSISVIIAVSNSLAGIIFSYFFDLATGPVIVSLLFINFLLLPLIKTKNLVIINKK